MQTLLKLFPCYSLFLFGGVSQAAVIVWSAAQNVTADTDVITTGTLVKAVHFGSATPYTINNVVFSGDTVIPSGWWWNTTGLNGASSISGIGAGYTSALDGYIGSSGYVSSNLTVTGLTIGSTYILQFWLNDLRNSLKDMSRWDTGNSTPSVTLESAGTGTSSYAQFATATFTADATSQIFRVTGINPGDAGPFVNMYQLRDITPAPEPSSFLLLGAAGLGALSLRRRRTS